MGFEFDGASEDSIKLSYAKEQAVDEFKQGVHEVYSDLSGAYEFLKTSEGGVFCKIIRDGESGDMSVGISSWEAWTLADDQENTILDKLINDHIKINAIKELINNNLEDCKSSDDYYLAVQMLKTIIQEYNVN